MSEHFRSSIILASAGTGKTYQLTERYVGLLGLGVPPSRILATTFTRQAAGQIFDRVLGRLLDAKNTAPLRELLRGLDRLGISTLDSLFAKLASSYAADLGLPPGWKIVDDDEDERLRAHAVELALEDGERENVLTLLRLMMAKRFSSSVAAGLLSKVDDAHGVFQSAPTKAWSVIDVPPEFQALSREERENILASWDKVPMHMVSKGTRPDSRWVDAHVKAFNAAKNEEWESFLDCGLAAKIIAGDSTYQKGPITDALIRAYQPLIDHARRALLSRHVEGTLALRDLLNRFDRAYDSLKRKHRAYRFDDVPRALRSIDRDITLDEIAFRVDSRVDHVLLDEFQDTSSSQFALLEPLLSEILSGGGGLHEDASTRSVFCVGDVKQSLYQWRDAEPGLFAALPRRWPQLDQSYLNESYRSSPIVLQAVNQVFGSIAANPALSWCPDAAAAWRAQFKEHTSAPQLKNAPGCVRLIVAPSAIKGEGQDVLTLRAAATSVAELVQKHPGVSVGILVRAKKRIPRIIFELKKLGVDASEEGGNPLTDAPAVAAALSALHLAEHPGDTAAAFHVATSPLAALLGLHEWTGEAPRRHAASRIREHAIQGVTPLLSGWLESLAPSCDPRDVRRFEQLITLAQAFDSRNDPRLENFIAMARTKRVDDPATHPVRVLTIHASKGLEFDAVFLPDLDGTIASRSPGMLYQRSDPFGEIEAVTRYPNKLLRSLDPRLERLYQLHKSKAVSEELCVLYVALTRARHAIEMFIAPAKQNAKATTIPFSLAGILHQAFAPEAPLQTGELLEFGDPNWAAGRPPISPDRPSRPIEIKLAKGTSPARLGRERPPSHTSHRSRRNARAADRGTLLHAWAEQIEWLDNATLHALNDRPDEFLRIASALDLDPSINARKELAAFAAMIARPEIRQALSKERYLDSNPSLGLTLLRETPFSFARRESPHGSPKIITGRIDRLVVATLTDGSPAHAEVLDFKSDTLKDGVDPTSLAEQYRAQMELYRLAAARLTGLPADRVRCSLVLLSAGMTLNLSPPHLPLPDKSLHDS